MIEVTSEEELVQILNNNQVVIVDFWAPWCGPCRMLLTILDEIAKSEQGIVFIKINVDEAKEISEAHNVQTLPTIIAFKNAKEIESRAGFMSKSAIMDLIDSTR
jgi:thioredoxin 1